MCMAGAFGLGAVDDVIFSWRKLSFVWPLGRSGVRVLTPEFSEAGVRRSFPKLLLNHAEPKANVFCARVDSGHGSEKQAIFRAFFGDARRLFTMKIFDFPRKPI